jgi:uncharacterized protein YndB with AHSA1/START domain
MFSTDDLGEMRWRLHLSSSPSEVFQLWSTDVGRARFWAESTEERVGTIIFHFANGISYRGKILENDPPHRFQLVYFGGTVATIDLADDGREGTDLVLTDKGVLPEDQDEVLAGWVSVLLSLKAAVDFGVDLRNHDPSRAWDQRYAVN